MINTTGIFHNGEYYTWEMIYKISGLSGEDFLHDSAGSWEHFIECVSKWEG